MINLKNTKKRVVNQFIVLFIISVAATATPLYAKDNTNVKNGWLLASKNIDQNRMSISYDGNSEKLVDGSPVRKNPGAITAGSVEPLEIAKADIKPRNDIVWVGEKIKNLTQHMFRYVFFEEELDAGAAEKLERRSQRERNETNPQKMQLNVGVNIGVDEQTNEVVVNAVKFRSWGFATHLDAVYDYKTESVDMFLSNDILNAKLVEGMTLEFQLNPQKSEGAFLLNMRF